DNLIKSLPNITGGLSKLTKFNLSGNKIELSPDVLKKLMNLQFLDLSDNQIETLPDEIQELSELIHLDLSYNKIVTLPDTIVELSNLKNLYLFDNSIEALPHTISKLTKLETIDLSNNKNLLSLPSSLRNLKNSVCLLKLIDTNIQISCEGGALGQIQLEEIFGKRVVFSQGENRTEFSNPILAQLMNSDSFKLCILIAHLRSHFH
ncbi:MAG: leucine-rich repeat domain-containing protein, partial [Alphaproteobacteria bacterium]|nr:leucine-rich repeat domain-containing protein [Alphaproteobacteria bacterium]